MKLFFPALLWLGLAAATSGQSLQDKPEDAYFGKFKPLLAPAPARLLLKQGDRLAICGDSITEQKMFEVRSERYPFCAVGDESKDDNIRAAMALVPFNEELNRLTLLVTKPRAARYRVTWGKQSKSYPAEQLAKGVNLAADFPRNPFSEAFAGVDGAVAAKQEYETRQIKTLFHGPEAALEMETVVNLTERARGPLVTHVREAFVPVTHTIQLVAE